MSYEHDMKDEQEPKIKKLLPEGWRTMEIVACKEQVSKKGNDMFVITLRDIEKSYEEDVYAISKQGKRWYLKAILAACEIPASEDGVYKWDIEDILNKRIQVLNEHEENEYIDREGEKVETKQNRFSKFETLAWDEDK